MRIRSRFSRHHIRATFYHGGIILFLIASALFYRDWIDGDAYNTFCVALIIVDYIAEMYDPHPDNMGTWFERHFHRFFDGD